MERPATSSSSFPISLSFINISNPDEVKLRSKKRAVRSHVAYYQHHKDDETNNAESSVASLPRSSLSKRKREKRSSQQTITWNPSSGSSSSTNKAPGPTTTSKSERSLASVIGFSKSNSPPGFYPIIKGPQVYTLRPYLVPWKDFYNKILEFYIKEIAVDTTYTTPDGKPAGTFLLRTAFLPMVMQAPRLFYAAMSLSCALYHFRRKENIHNPSLLSLSQNAITSINESLSDPLLRAEDHTIAAVFCMCCVESMYGDSSAYQIHMSGLEKMVRLRGGLQSLGLDGLIARMIIWLDFNHAKVHGSMLYFGQSVEVERRPSPFRYKEYAELEGKGR